MRLGPTCRPWQSAGGISSEPGALHHAQLYNWHVHTLPKPQRSARLCDSRCLRQLIFAGHATCKQFASVNSKSQHVDFALHRSRNWSGCGFQCAHWRPAVCLRGGGLVLQHQPRMAYILWWAPSISTHCQHVYAPGALCIVESDQGSMK